jgi:hypothetical protein
VGATGAKGKFTTGNLWSVRPPDVWEVNSAPPGLLGCCVGASYGCLTVRAPARDSKDPCISVSPDCPALHWLSDQLPQSQQGQETTEV